MTGTQLLLFLCGFGVVQSLILTGVLLLHPRSEKSVNAPLALYILALSMTMYVPLVQYLVDWQTMLFFTSSRLLIGPAVYIYVRSYKEVITFGKTWVHLVPFVIVFSYIIYLRTSVVQQYPLSQLMPGEMVNSWQSWLVGLTHIVSMVIYFFFASKVLTSYQRSIRHLFSDTSKIDLNWVRWLLNGFLLIVVCNVIVYVLLRVSTPDKWRVIVLCNTTLTVIYVCIIAIRGISQSTLWQIQPGFDKVAVEVEMNQLTELDEKPKDKIADPDKTDGIIQKTIGLMEHEKIYRQSELTLQQLADRIQVPAYQVSQAINEGMKKNFYDLVNGYRVEEAKRLLADPRNRNLKILSCGMDAGFNSKTTFNTVFKKFTGYSPSDFRESSRV